MRSIQHKNLSRLAASVEESLLELGSEVLASGNTKG